MSSEKYNAVVLFVFASKRELVYDIFLYQLEMGIEPKYLSSG